MSKPEKKLSSKEIVEEFPTEISQEKPALEVHRRDPSCIFCKIVEGNLPSSRIAENSYSLAIMSLEGHPLVMPKNHTSTEDLEQGKHLADATQTATLALELVPAVKRAYQASGINFFTALGKDAGQEINHFHIHLIPRTHGDKRIRFKEFERFSTKELRTLASKVRNELPDSLKKTV